MTKVICINSDVQESNIITGALLPGVIQSNSVADVLALPDLERIAFLFHNDGCYVPFIVDSDADHFVAVEAPVAPRRASEAT